MKSLQELYVETIKNEKMTKAFLAAYEAGDEELEQFLKTYGCDASLAQLKNFLAKIEENTEPEQKEEIVELGIDDLEIVAGGSKAGAKKFFKGVYDNSIGELVDGAVDIAESGYNVLKSTKKDLIDCGSNW